MFDVFRKKYDRTPPDQQDRVPPGFHLQPPPIEPPQQPVIRIDRLRIAAPRGHPVRTAADTNGSVVGEGRTTLV